MKIGESETVRKCGEMKKDKGVNSTMKKDKGANSTKDTFTQ